MKKFFTLIATVAVALTANAQLLTFADEAAGTKEVTLGTDGGFQVYVNTDKTGVGTDSGKRFGSATTASVVITNVFKVGAQVDGSTRIVKATIPSAGTLKVYARPSNSSDTQTTIIATQNGSEILNQTLDGTTASVQSTDGKNCYPYYETSVAAGTVDITTVKDHNANFYGFEFVAGEGGGEGGEGGETSTTVIASYSNGTKTGTWSIVGTNAASGSLEYAAKYNKNTTSVTTITFPNSATKEGAWSYAVKLEGEFLAGDKITIQPFTAMSADDYTSGTKYANILLYCEKDGAPKSIADMTGSAAGALTVTDGHEQEGTPQTFEYTLTENYTNLFFARGGNSRINLMMVKVERAEATAVEAIAENAPAVAKTVKVIKNGKLYIGNYNIAGQQVK